MRIAMLHKTLPGASGGGVIWQVHGLANELVKRGHRVTVFSFCDKPADARYEVELIGPSSVLNSRGRRYYAPAFYYARRSFAMFDVVHAHGDDHLMLRRSCAHVRTFYGSALGEAVHATSQKVRTLMLALYPFECVSALLAGTCVAVSAATRRYIPFIQQVVPCGVDLDLFRPMAEKSANPSVLFVGTLDGRKRGRWLLEVFARCVSVEVPDAELWMVCEDVDGANVRVPDQVRMFRRIPAEALAELYRKAWVFCLPSTYEGFGVPYIEAMASGTPVVATPNAGALEVLDGGNCGLIVPESELGPALAALLVSRAQRCRVAEAGLRWVTRFRWESVAEQYEHVYENVIRKTSRARSVGPSARRADASEGGAFSDAR